MANFISLTSCNVRGIQSAKNRNEKMNILLQIKTDILCLQEMRLKSISDVNDVKDMWTKGTSVISVGDDNADGVGIIFFFK